MNAPLRLRSFAASMATSGTGVMVFGTLVAALAAYGFQLVAGRALGPEAFAPITVLWTIQFLVLTTVFMPMEQLTIRRLAAERPDAAPYRLYSAVIVGSVVVSVAFGVVTLDRLLEGKPVYLGVIAVVIAAYGGFAIARGALAGQRRFREYGWATLAESVARLAVAAGLLALGFGVVGVAWSLVPGALVVYLWRPFAGEQNEDAPPPPLAGSASALATFVSANAASQTILAAGPLVVGALGAGAAEVSVFFETFLLFRAPLTVAYSLVARVLPPFTRIAESSDGAILSRWARRLLLAGLAAAGVAFVVGRWIGPDLVALLLGEEFRPGSQLAAYAASGVVIATAALFTQQMLIATRSTGTLALAWLAGLVGATVGVALLGGSPSLRVGAGFLIGETVAFFAIVTAVIARTGATRKT